MYTKNLTVREMYASIGLTSFIVELFEKGLEMDNDRLAVSAMEELLRRGDYDSVVGALSRAFDKGQLALGTTMTTMIANSLMDGAREIDPMLQKYGEGLLHGEFMGPCEWVCMNADRFRKVYRCGLVKNAHPWASALIWGDNPVLDNH